MLPVYIILEDQDGGYILGEFKEEHIVLGSPPIYRYKEYYHTIESAVNDGLRASNKVRKARE